MATFVAIFVPIQHPIFIDHKAYKPRTDILLYIHVADFIIHHNPYALYIHVNLADFCHVHIHTYIHGGQFYEQILEHIRHGHSLYVVGRPTQWTDAPSTPFTLLQHGRTLQWTRTRGSHTWCTLEPVTCNNMALLGVACIDLNYMYCQIWNTLSKTIKNSQQKAELLYPIAFFCKIQARLNINLTLLQLYDGNFSLYR